MSPHIGFDHRRFTSGALMVIVSFIGCDVMRNSKMYSGTFSTISHFPQNVVILNWEGFGDFPNPGPGGGNLIPDAIKTDKFDPVKTFPEVVVVTWVVEGETEIKRQEIKLKGVVPVGVQGRTHFELNKEGVWNVSFRTGKLSLNEK